VQSRPEANGDGGDIKQQFNPVFCIDRIAPADAMQGAVESPNATTPVALPVCEASQVTPSITNFPLLVGFARTFIFDPFCTVPHRQTGGSRR
jgi:hypothetical protein